MSSESGPTMDLSAFTDILTCILGILILIILLTGLDAAQISVLIATPKELAGHDKSPVFFECRNNTLFGISTARLKDAFLERSEELLQQVAHNENEFLREGATVQISIDGQKMDFMTAMTGRYRLMPDFTAEGYRLPKRFLDETNDMWYGSQLDAINPETQFVCFFVRPDSFKVFQQARALAWLRGIDVSVELQDERNPLVFGHGGQQIKPL